MEDSGEGTSKVIVDEPEEEERRREDQARRETVGRRTEREEGSMMSSREVEMEAVAERGLTGDGRGADNPIESLADELLSQ